MISVEIPCLHVASGGPYYITRHRRGTLWLGMGTTGLLPWSPTQCSLKKYLNLCTCLCVSKKKTKLTPWLRHERLQNLLCKTKAENCRCTMLHKRKYVKESGQKQNQVVKNMLRCVMMML